jgi:hypothetical protein
MPEKRRTRPLGLILIFLMLMGISTVSGLTVSAENAKMQVAGETTQVTIRLDEVPKGLAGYNISLTVSDPHVAEITQLAPPLWAIPSRTSPLPSDHVWITGIDFSRIVQPGAKNVVLATITIHGLKEGESALNVTVTRIDDDGGYPIKPSIQDGIITIGDERIPTVIPTEPLETISTIPETNPALSEIPVVTVTSAPVFSLQPSLTGADNAITRFKTPVLYVENKTDNARTGTDGHQENNIFNQISSFFRMLFGNR